MNEDYCTKCGLDLEEGEGRFNYPKGAMCRVCGNPASLLMKEIEDNLEKYKEITGYAPRLRF